MVDMNPRTCIVTRKEKSPEEMIRFALDGENRVIPDLKRTLPGRGVWVTGGMSYVSMAIEKALFARGFKSQVDPSDDLPLLVDRLLAAAALASLSLARKAGKLVPGRANVEKAISSGQSALLIHATDAAKDGQEKIDRIVNQVVEPIDIFRLFSSEELDQVSGVANTMHLAVIDSGIADKTRELFSKLRVYRAN